MSSNEAQQKEAFSQVIFANKTEYDFEISIPIHEALTSNSEETGKDSAIQAVMAEVSDFVSKLPQKSKIIRRFQRFSEGANEMDAEGAAMAFADSFRNARAAFGKADTEMPFSSLLIEAANREVGEAYPGDAVMEWFLVNDIDGQVSQLVKDLNKYYAINLESEHVLEATTDACDDAVESFLEGHDKSTGLDVLSKKGDIEFLITPMQELNSGFFSACEPLTIDNFSELGVSGMTPDSAMQNLMKMAGVTAQMIIGELRDEMEPERLLEWNSLGQEATQSIAGAKMNVQDFLDLVELAGEKGGHPAYVTELAPSSFESIQPGDKVSLEQVGLAVIAESGEVLGVRILENPLVIEYAPETMMPSCEVGSDILLSASLKKGELASSMSKVEMSIQEDKEKNLEEGLSPY